jgi:hypothetical protein
MQIAFGFIPNVLSVSVCEVIDPCASVRFAFTDPGVSAEALFLVLEPCSDVCVTGGVCEFAVSIFDAVLKGSGVSVDSGLQSAL